MDGIGEPIRHTGVEGSVLKTAHVDAADKEAVRNLRIALGDDPLALLVLLASSEADFAQLVQKAATAFPDAAIIGCTTAGEICSEGYTEREVVAVGFPRAHFIADVLTLPDLSQLDQHDIIGRLVRMRANLAEMHPDWQSEFAFLTVDGLSLREDALAATIAPGLGPVPLFGGSAGDGTRFEQTFVASGGKVYQNAAVLAFVRTVCDVRVFSLNNLVPTERRMVVTAAEPDRRIVRTLNAEPAAREYARLLGKDPEQLDTFTFAAHPVVVRLAGTHHVRAIQQVAENGDLVFFSAIDEGLVLTLAEPEDMVTHLARELDALDGPSSIFACDCILRRVAAQQKQMTSQISDLLAAHNVIGFSTYGEQLNGMHVNQTMTGVAIYPPGRTGK